MKRRSVSNEPASAAFSLHQAFIVFLSDGTGEVSCTLPSYRQYRLATKGGATPKLLTRQESRLLDELIQVLPFRGYVTERETFCHKRKVIGIGKFNAPSREFVRLAVWIDWNSGQQSCRDQRMHVRRKVARAAAISRHSILNAGDVFFHFQSAQVCYGICSYLLVLAGFVSCRPDRACHLRITSVLGHLSSQHLHEWMRAFDRGAFLKRFGRFLILLQFHVVNEAQVVIELPRCWIFLNSVLDQLHRLVRNSSTMGRRWGQEVGSKLVSNQELGIKGCCDIEQRIKRLIAACVL